MRDVFTLDDATGSSGTEHSTTDAAGDALPDPQHLPLLAVPTISTITPLHLLLQRFPPWALPYGRVVPPADIPSAAASFPTTSNSG